MNIRKFTEVSARLEKAITASLDDCSTPLEKYQLYEETAIAILDSEFMEYPDGLLEDYLMDYLASKRQEFGLDLSR